MKILYMEGTPLIEVIFAYIIDSVARVFGHNNIAIRHNPKILKSWSSNIR